MSEKETKHANPYNYQANSPAGRLSWPFLEKPKAYGGEDKPERYSTTQLVPEKVWEGSHMQEVREQLQEFANRRWGKPEGSKGAKFRLTGIKRPDLDSDDEIISTHWAIKASATPKFRPQLFDVDGNLVDPLEYEPGEINRLFYPGANAVVRIRPYLFDGNREKGYTQGISFNLIGVRVLGGGESFLKVDVEAEKAKQAAETAAALGSIPAVITGGSKPVEEAKDVDAIDGFGDLD